MFNEHGPMPNRDRDDLRSYLSVRHIQAVVRTAVREAGLLKPVSPMTLRHTYAVHALEDGISVREVQENLGHVSIETTMIYLRCIPPADTASPLDQTANHTRVFVPTKSCNPLPYIAAHLANTHLQPAYTQQDSTTVPKPLC